MLIPFGEWLPDLPVFANPGATVARNVIPGPVSYQPLPGLSAYSSNALDAYCRGAVAVRDNDQNAFLFAGDAGKLYQLSGTAWANASKSGNYSLPGGENWEFAKFGNDLLAVCFDEPVQAQSIGSGSFSDHVTSSRKPQARHIGVVRDFVVLGNVTDSTDGNKPERVWWSAIDDSADFDPDAATQCDYQDLVGSGGPVRKVVGGEYGVVFKERSIYRMDYIGPPEVFSFAEVDQFRGAIAPGSVVRVGRAVYYWAHDGVYLFNGATSQPIGENKVNDTLLADLDTDHLDRVSGAADPTRAVIFWAYPGAGNSGGQPNKLLIHHWPTRRFADAELDCGCIAQLHSGSTTLEELDSVSSSLDALGISLDARLWKGGDLVLGAFTDAGKLGFFNGAAMAATVETGEVQPSQPQRTLVRTLRAHVEGPEQTTQLAVGVRERQQDAVSWGPGLSVNASGFYDTRANGRYHRFRAEIAGGFSHAQGVEIVESRPVGLR
jgi:hypothetical protein